MTNIGSSVIALPITAGMLLVLLAWTTLIARRNKDTASNPGSRGDAECPLEGDTADERETAEHP
ncbi:hypothetical protein GCM10023063_15360 [Arthrobacter methylotrophus]|uniref:LPXTG cell wall anchor domain-containing protein n=1 Tax=Arthrobacter methylotrophus TaxID=121291 RepID=A0ABV5UN67_9MICC